MNSSLLCIYLLKWSLRRSCTERLIDLRRPFFDVNDNPFDRYITFLRISDRVFIPGLHSVLQSKVNYKKGKIRKKFCY